MRRHLKTAIAIAGLFAVATGATAADMKFEMADVHPSAHSSSQQVYMRAGFYRGGRYQVRSATMVDLIGLAYGVDNDKVLQGPNWLDFDRFDILATAPANATPAAIKTMLQALLAERFSLTLHIDKKDAPTFALTVGKKTQMKEADGSGETGCQYQVSGMQNGPAQADAPQANPVLNFTCHNMTMAALAEYMHDMPLSNQFLGTNPLVDDTGLEGAWNLEFHFQLGNGVSGPAMLDTFEKQTGIKLEARKVPLPVVIVDSAHEKPTPNAPGVSEKLPVSATEFEVADIKPSDPNATNQNQSGGFQPGGRLDLHRITLKQLITIAWDTTDGLVSGGPKFIDTDLYDVVAKAPASALSGTSNQSGRQNQAPMDVDALRLMLRALIIDRFKLTTHVEDKPMDAYTLLADKPKMKKADPSNRTGYKEGPGPDGKDPRKETPSLGRLVTCQNMTMAQLAELLPSIAGGYFQTFSRTVLDSTGLDGAYDFTLSFSGAGILKGNNGGGRGGDAPRAAGADGGTATASDPGGGITLMDAMDKQIGIKMITTKRPVPVLVIDHIEQKPTDN